MGFWSNLVKIGGFAAAPFTAGMSIPIANAASGMMDAHSQKTAAIDAASKGMGGASQAMASNRGTKAEMMMDQNSALERELLAREQEKRTARNDAAHNAFMGAGVANYKPTQGPPGTNVVRFGGGDPTTGLGGSIGNPQAVGAANVLSAQGMNRLGQPDLAVDGGGMMPAYRNLANDKAFNKTMNPGIMEKIMGYGSAFTPLLGAMLNRQGSGAPQSNQPSQYSYNTQGSVVK